MRYLFLAGFPLQAPLVYHYGHLSPGPNEKLYNKISSKIAEVTKERFEKNKKGEPLFSQLTYLFMYCLLCLNFLNFGIFLWSVVL